MAVTLLRTGMQGNEVLMVQTLLNEVFADEDTRLDESGIFDVDTAKAVSLFQAEYGLPVTGQMGIEDTKRLQEVILQIRESDGGTQEGSNVILDPVNVKGLGPLGWVLISLVVIGGGYWYWRKSKRVG